jgi:hypothetical protein
LNLDCKLDEIFSFMKEINPAKITSTSRVKKCIKNLTKNDFGPNLFGLYKNIFDGIKKTKTKRQFSYYFLIKMLDFNRKESDIKLLIDYHAAKLPNSSKYDFILYQSISEIINFYLKAKRLRQMKKNIMNIKNMHIGIPIKGRGNSDIYASTQKISMKPLRG